MRRIDTYFWFRGEPGDSLTPLLPKVWRDDHNENTLNQLFRMRAPAVSTTPYPDRGNTDQWLFLAQHVGLPTRLLDWTESALAGLYFALLTDDPVVWVLGPRELNQLSPPHTADFPLTWADPDDPKAAGNIALAWAQDRSEPNAHAVTLPVAVLPTNIHTRMSAQRSCFTIHGTSHDSLLTQLDKNEPSPLVARIRLPSNAAQRRSMLEHLRFLGVSGTTMFPDLQGLAQELAAIQ